MNKALVFDQMSAMGTDLSSEAPARDPDKWEIFAYKPGDDKREVLGTNLTREDVAEKLGEVDKLNQAGFNIYIAPNGVASRDLHFSVPVDDAKSLRYVEKLKDCGFAPSFVSWTGDQKLDVVLKTHTPLTVKEKENAQKLVIEEVKKKDPELASKIIPSNDVGMLLAGTDRHLASNEIMGGRLTNELHLTLDARDGKAIEHIQKLKDCGFTPDKVSWTGDQKLDVVLRTEPGQEIVAAKVPEAERFAVTKIIEANPGMAAVLEPGRRAPGITNTQDANKSPVLVLEAKGGTFARSAEIVAHVRPQQEKDLTKRSKGPGVKLPSRVSHDAEKILGHLLEVGRD